MQVETPSQERRAGGQRSTTPIGDHDARNAPSRPENKYGRIRNISGPAPTAAGEDSEASPGGQPVAVPPSVPAKQRAERLISLDAFRGLTVAVMLLVNNAVLDKYVPRPFVHAEFGQSPTLADMVFPWFLLVVGIAIPFSAAGKREQGMRAWQRGMMAFRRAVALYLVGDLIDSSLLHSPYWGLGVLQLIGLAYLAARAIYVLPAFLRAIVAAGLLGFYAWALSGLAYAGFKPGGFTETHNLAAYLNDNYLAAYQMQGLMSVIPTAALALIGTLIGDGLARTRDVPASRAALLFAFGSGLMLIGMVWNLYQPMSKTFWTPSYITFAAGWGTLVFFALYLVADVAGNAWRPFRWPAVPLAIFGANALIAYAGAILVKLHILQEWKIWHAGEKMTLQGAFLDTLTSRYGVVTGGWLYMAAYLGTVWLVCAYLYQKRIFVRA